MKSFSLGLVFGTSLVLQIIMIGQQKLIPQTCQTQIGSAYSSKEWMKGWSMAKGFSTVNMTTNMSHECMTLY